MNLRRAVLRATGVVLLIVLAAGSLRTRPRASGVRGPSAGISPEARQAAVVRDITGIRDVPCEQAREIIREHQGDANFVILDFRTKEMFDQAHIEGAVVHDVFSPDIGGWLESLDRNKIYLIYCTLGHRSGIALAKMKDMGFANILHMYEGITRWKELGYETVPGNELLTSQEINVPAPPASTPR